MVPEAIYSSFSIMDDKELLFISTDNLRMKLVRYYKVVGNDEARAFLVYNWSKWNSLATVSKLLPTSDNFESSLNF